MPTHTPPERDASSEPEVVPQKPSPMPLIGLFCTDEAQGQALVWPITSPDLLVAAGKRLSEPVPDGLTLGPRTEDHFRGIIP